MKQKIHGESRTWLKFQKGQDFPILEMFNFLFKSDV